MFGLWSLVCSIACLFCSYCGDRLVAGGALAVGGVVVALLLAAAAAAGGGAGQ